MTSSIGQIEKRMQIIKIAISLTDEETINLQCSILKKYKNDKQLENILSVLDDGKYVQASNLIDRYIRGPYDADNHNDTVMESSDRSSLSSGYSRDEESLIKKFGLFVDGDKSESYLEMDEDAILSASESIENDKHAPTDAEPDIEDILSQYESIDQDRIPRSDRMGLQGENLPKSKSGNKEDGEPGERKSSENEDKEADWEHTIEYAPISYIDQKVKNMLNQYPQVEQSEEIFESEEKLLYKISLEGYTEDDIEESIEKVYSLREEGKLAEAAHLLLIAASTESLYAQFVLARELFRGTILQQDIPEAFTQINRMALDNYPEAICDLAQFHEHGIVVSKDIKKAFSLYKEAYDKGIQRADTHLNRLQDASDGLMSRLFGA